MPYACSAYFIFKAFIRYCWPSEVIISLCICDKPKIHLLWQIVFLLSIHPLFETGHLIAISSVQFSLVAQSCPTLCDPMNHSTLGLLVHHQLPEFSQTHVHRVSDAIQPSDPLSSPSPPAPNPSQHQEKEMATHSSILAWRIPWAEGPG